MKEVLNECDCSTPGLDKLICVFFSTSFIIVFTFLYTLVGEGMLLECFCWNFYTPKVDMTYTFSKVCIYYYMQHIIIRKKFLSLYVQANITYVLKWKLKLLYCRRSHTNWMAEPIGWKAAGYWKKVGLNSRTILSFISHFLFLFSDWWSY